MPVVTTGNIALTGGDDGLRGLDDADYIGVSAHKTGLYAFDTVNDALQIATPGVTAAAVIAAGLAYCESRKDMMYICETPANLDPQGAVDFRKGEGDYDHAVFNSSYGGIVLPQAESVRRGVLEGAHGFSCRRRPRNYGRQRLEG